jgi:hypothetical protein
MTEMSPKKTSPQPLSGAATSTGWFTRLVLSLSLFVAALLAYSFLNNYENWGDDWAQYLLQAKAILNRDVEGYVQQYAFMVRESDEWRDSLGAASWGLPLLLALEGSLFSFDLQVFKIFNILFFLLLVLAIFRLARRFLTDAEAFAAACVFAFNPVLLHYCNHILTEIPFTLVSVCAFIAMEDRDPRGRLRIPSQLLTGTLAFIAFTLRTNGILILAAATAREFLPGTAEKVWCRPPLRALPSPYVSFGLLYAIWNVVFPAGGAGNLQMLRYVSVDTLVDNALRYPVSLFDFFTGGHRSAVVAAVLGPLVLLGACKSWRKTAHFSVYGVLTLALYSVWPYYQYRYIIPVTPFLVIFMMLGLDEFAHWKTAGKIGPVLARFVQYGVPISFLVAALVLVGTGRLPQEKWNPYDQPSSEMFQWVRSNTAKDAVISFFKPRAMQLLGERICLLAAPVDLRKASYFVYTKELTWNEGQPLLQEYQQAAELTPVFENQNFVVYRVGPRPRHASQGDEFAEIKRAADPP